MVRASEKFTPSDGNALVQYISGELSSDDEGNLDNSLIKGSINSQKNPSFVEAQDETPLDQSFDATVDGIQNIDSYGAALLQGFARPRPEAVESVLVITETPDEFL